MSLTTNHPRASSLELVPALGTLDRAECEALLKRNVVGRLAFALQDRVNIVPVHFVYDEGWIYGRTAPEGKLVPILRNRRVAFEVDEHQGMFSWQSVVVHGSMYLIDPDAGDKEKAAEETALRLMRRILPSTLGKADPVPFRNQLFRIQVSEISGRFSALGGTRTETPNDRTRDEGADAEADARLRESVLGALSTLSPPSLSRIHVDAFDGMVVLSGLVDTPTERNEIEREVLRVENVRAVVQQLETAFPVQRHPAATELARDAIRQLGQSPELSSASVKVVVEHEWLRAEGAAATPALKDEAIRRLRDVSGARGVIDRIHVENGSA